MFSRQIGHCNAADSSAVLQRDCLGKHSCSVQVAVETFKDPCHLTHKKLAWHVSCSKADSAVQINSNSNNGTSTVIIDYGLEMQGGKRVPVDSCENRSKVADFTGVNITFAHGVAGQTISVKLSEELVPETCASIDCATALKVPMRTTNDFEDLWTLRDGPQTIMQHEYMVR
eukprot:SAG31_NODE_285_length_18479_cov_9.871980_10_plen_172_part_00